MSSEFDELEKFVMAEMRKLYSEKALDHSLRPRNVGRIKDAEGFARVTGPCGDTIEISLRIKAEKVVDAAFWTDGCGSSAACGSATTELVKGKSVAEASNIDSNHILDALDGLPESDIHCAVLASNTLKAAIRNYRMIDRNISHKARLTVVEGL